MLNYHRPVLGFLYLLLFVSFVAMSLGQAVGGWISTTYGGWVTLEAVAAYGAYLAGLIWVINRVNKAAGFEPPATSPPPVPVMTEMEFIRRQAREREDVEVRPVEAPVAEGEQKAKL